MLTLHAHKSNDNIYRSTKEKQRRKVVQSLKIEMKIWFNGKEVSEPLSVKHALCTQKAK